MKRLVPVLGILALALMPGLAAAQCYSSQGYSQSYAPQSQTQTYQTYSSPSCPSGGCVVMAPSTSTYALPPAPQTTAQVQPQAQSSGCYGGQAYSLPSQPPAVVYSTPAPQSRQVINFPPPPISRSEIYLAPIPQAPAPPRRDRPRFAHATIVNVYTPPARPGLLGRLLGRR